MGKGGGGASVDPSAAMASYQAGADAIAKAFPDALKTFTNLAGSAFAQELQQYGQSQSQAAPYSQTALDSVNELRFYMGMAPVSKSVGMSSLAGGVSGPTLPGGLSASQTESTGPFNNYMGQITAAMQNAESITDPAQRAAMKAQISQQITNLSNSLQNEVIYNSNVRHYFNMLPAKGVPFSNRGEVQGSNPTGVMPLVNLNTEAGSTGRPDLNYTWKGLPEGADPTKYGYTDYLPTDINGSVTDLPRLSTQLLNGIGPRDDPQGAHVDDVIPSYENTIAQLNTLQTQWNNQYQVAAPQAPTAQQVMDKLTATPGYQTNLQQGEQTLTRSQAARGVLQSGNALLEAQKFGADYATNAYQQQIANLSNLAGINMPIQQQSIANTLGQGQTALNQGNAVAGMGYQNATDIARARQSAFDKSGDAQLQAAMMNAQLKQASQSSMMGGIGQLAGSVLGMIL